MKLAAIIISVAVCVALVDASFETGNKMARDHKLMARDHKLMARVKRAQFEATRRKLGKRCAAKTAAEATTPAAASPASTAAAANTSAAAAAPPPVSKPAPPPTSHPASPATSSTHASPPANTTAPGPANGHKFTLINKCSNTIQPVVADTSCGYSPRCSDAARFSGPRPKAIAPGQTSAIMVDNKWVGRMFADNGKCGAKGEGCTMLEFNLDSGSQWTPQAYDISNIQGFTQPISLKADGCDAVTCTSASCSCSDAYPVGDMSGCGNDLPVRACGAGPIGFQVTFCP